MSGAQEGQLWGYCMATTGAQRYSGLGKEKDVKWCVV